jgi:NAD-dependent deacetylase
MVVAPWTESAPLDVAIGTNVFVLTGAGVSAESGIPTFRDAGGLWKTYRVEDIAYADSFAKDPALVWRFMSEMREGAAAVAPNAAHVALEQLEERLVDWLFLCTQNIDDLHERAGSKWPVHIHGQIFRSRCSREGCGEPFADRRLYRTLAEIPRCATCGSLIRPDIVAFGEMPLELTRIYAALAVCDLYVAIGTSGSVLPAAGFPTGLRKRPSPPRMIYVGPEAPENADLFDECRLGRATEVVPALFHAPVLSDELKGGTSRP